MNSPSQSTRVLPDLPPASLAAHYPGARIAALAGGRANRAWCVTPPDGPALVVKLHDPDRATPLFPNDADAEARALHLLDGTGLAPRPVADGPWLSYAFVFGQTPCTDPSTAGRALARLHAIPAPDGFRSLSGGHAEVLGLGDTLAAGRSDLVALRPGGAVPPSDRQAFLHGDPVPANLVGTKDGAVLIDWQCPAVGDPCEDIAVWLSPAMQSLYGGNRLDPAAIETFFAAYGDAEIAARYRALAPAYHWRMAAYCLWMAARGHGDYAAAAELEIAALQN